MNLEILSFGKAMEHVPPENSYAIRISHSEYKMPLPDLIESENWIGVSEYCFDDIWPNRWQEYSWIDRDDPYFSGALSKSWEEVSAEYPKMTKDSLISLLESKGQPWGRSILFDEETAKRILSDYEKVARDVDNIMIHCSRGENRAPAVGIAMNEIYGWGIEGLKEKFLGYRRFVYDIMKSVG